MPGSPDTQYIFDSSFELGYITGDVYDWLYNLDFNLDALVDYREGLLTKEQFEAKLARSEVRELFYTNDCSEGDLQELVTDCFDVGYQSMPLEQKCFYDLSILFGSQEQPRSMQYHLAKRLTDCYFGNSWHQPILTLTDERELDKIENVQYILENDRVLSQWVPRMKNRIAESHDNIRSVNKAKLRDFLISEQERRERKIREALQAYHANFPIEQRRERQNDIRSITYGSMSAENKKRARKSISKAMDLFGKLFNRKDIEGFIKGYEYIVEGDKFNYRLTKSDRTSILHHTLNPKSFHIPYDLEITTKNNVVLTQVCYLFDNTPIIDQIIAFTLMIKSGNEDDSLNKANFFNITPEYANSELAQMRREKNYLPRAEGEVTLNDILTCPLTLDEIENPERRLWVNRITERSNELFANALGIDYAQWQHFLSPQTNLGHIMDQPTLIEDFTI